MRIEEVQSKDLAMYYPAREASSFVCYPRFRYPHARPLRFVHQEWRILSTDPSGRTSVWPKVCLHAPANGSGALAKRLHHRGPLLRNISSH